MIDLSNLGIEKAMELNAKLQTKKNALRKELSEKGVMEKDKKNEFDRYKYFSESGYKKLFTQLFSTTGLELTVTEKQIEDITGTDKQPFGRRVTLIFILSDTDTGYFEKSEFSGEGFDKGDKGIYKAYTGALKYYLASTFNVATGDDPEVESPDGKKEQNVRGVNKKKEEDQDAGNELVKKMNIDALNMKMKKKGVTALQICTTYKINNLNEMTLEIWKNAMNRLDATKDKQETDIGL